MKDHETATGVSVPVVILAPPEIRIPLVPLSAVHDLRMNQVWATIMLAIWSSILGALISFLLSTEPDRKILVLLVVFLALFSVLSLALCWGWWKKRRDLEAQARRAVHKSLRRSGEEVIAD